MGEKKNAYTTLAAQCEGNTLTPLQTGWYWDVLTEYMGVLWINLAQGGVQWQSYKQSNKCLHFNSCGPAKWCDFQRKPIYTPCVSEWVCLPQKASTLTLPDVSVSFDSICKMLTTKILRSFSLPIMWNIFLEYPTNKKKKKLNHAVWKSLLRMAQQTHHSDLCKALPETSSAQDAERFHFTQIQ
jgi:hypothetical protein